MNITQFCVMSKTSAAGLCGTVLCVCLRMRQRLKQRIHCNCITQVDSLI